MPPPRTPRRNAAPHDQPGRTMSATDPGTGGRNGGRRDKSKRAGRGRRPNRGQSRPASAATKQDTILAALMPAGYDKAQIDALKIPATGTNAAYRANTTFDAVAAMSRERGLPRGGPRRRRAQDRAARCPRAHRRHQRQPLPHQADGPGRDWPGGSLPRRAYCQGRRRHAPRRRHCGVPPPTPTAVPAARPTT